MKVWKQNVSYCCYAKSNTHLPFRCLVFFSRTQWMFSVGDGSLLQKGRRSACHTAFLWLSMSSQMCCPCFMHYCSPLQRLVSLFLNRALITSEMTLLFSGFGYCYSFYVGIDHLLVIYIWNKWLIFKSKQENLHIKHQCLPHITSFILIRLLSRLHCWFSVFLLFSLASVYVLWVFWYICLYCDNSVQTFFMHTMN